jgi:hypothetical protein
MPTGPEHYLLAEGHLAQAREHHDVRPEESAWHQGQAAVHAQLAGVAWHASGIFSRTGWMAATLTAAEQELPPVITRQDSEKRMEDWTAAGRLGHEFTRPAERLCRICGSSPDGIQHDEKKWPRDGQPR